MTIFGRPSLYRWLCSLANLWDSLAGVLTLGVVRIDTEDRVCNWLIARRRAKIQTAEDGEDAER